MVSKPAYLSVEIVTDNPTSGKISIPQLVFGVEQTGLYLTWSQPQYLCQSACVSTLHANWCYLQTFILTSFKNIFHVSDLVRLHVYVIVSSSLKPYQNFGLVCGLWLWYFLIILTYYFWSKFRLFANVFSGDSWSKRPTSSNQTMGILSGRARRVSGHDAWKCTLHMKICQTPNT